MAKPRQCQGNLADRGLQIMTALLTAVHHNKDMVRPCPCRAWLAYMCETTRARSIAMSLIPNRVPAPWLVRAAVAAGCAILLSGCVVYPAGYYGPPRPAYYYGGYYGGGGYYAPGYR
jgi:hypothetical protein